MTGTVSLGLPLAKTVGHPDRSVLYTVYSLSGARHALRQVSTASTIMRTPLVGDISHPRSVSAVHVNPHYFSSRPRRMTASAVLSEVSDGARSILADPLIRSVMCLAWV